MYLGVVGMIPSNFDLVDEAHAREIAALGVTGVGAHASGNPYEMSPVWVRRLRDILADQGIQIVQFWGEYSRLSHPTRPSVRRVSIMPAGL